MQAAAKGGRWRSRFGEGALECRALERLSDPSISLSGCPYASPRKKPYFTSIALGVALGYRRLQDAGTWTVRANTGNGSRWTRVFAIADDNEDANGDSVLNFWQAQDKARAIARADHVTIGDRPITVSEALTNYEAELTARGGDSRNVSRVRHHLPAALGAKTVGTLNARELRHWRDGLHKKGLATARRPHSTHIESGTNSRSARRSPDHQYCRLVRRPSLAA